MKKIITETTSKYVDISQVTDAKYSGQYLSFHGEVSHKDTNPFIADAEIDMECTPADDTAMCSKCPNAQLGKQSKIQFKNKKCV